MCQVDMYVDDKWLIQQKEIFKWREILLFICLEERIGDGWDVSGKEAWVFCYHWADLLSVDYWFFEYGFYQK